MLFDERPKDNLKDLFDREVEMEKFGNAIKMKRALIIISGFRRVGKTSLLKTMISQSVTYSIFIDLRNLAAKKTATRKDVIDLIQSSLQEFLDNNKSVAGQIVDALRTVRGVSITTPAGGFGIQLEPKSEKELDLSGLFNRIDRWAKDHGEIVLLSIDEAQQFRKAQQFNMTGLLASIFDSCKNIVTVLTGSEVGLLYEFMGIEDTTADLYGRSYVEINVEHLSKEKSREFLLKGFEQYNMERQKMVVGTDAIELAVEQLGGILGWLIKFGLKCVERGSITAENLDEIRKEGAKLAKEEYDKFIATRKATERYDVIMKTLAAQPSTWDSIKTQLHLETKKIIYNKNLSDLLSTLQKAGFINKDGDKYYIEDPLLKEAFSK